jgi:hypothetical protein
MKAAGNPFLGPGKQYNNIQLTSTSSPELEGEVLDDLLDLRVDGGMLLTLYGFV